MTLPEGPAVGRGAVRSLAGGLLAALLFLAIWLPLHPARPHQPTSDLYTHLGVARHLLRGQGFVTDLAYPLSFAYPFARELPQPLIHRPPGFGLLLTAPVGLAQGDPQRALDNVRLLQIVLLGGLAWLGSSAWLRRGRPGAAVGWLVLLGANPLLTFAVDWGMAELAAALVLLAGWLRHRRGARAPGPGDGLLAGALSLLRPELLWVPVLWWLLLNRSGRPDGRRLALTAAAFLLLAGPWLLRNAALTGDPLFSLQARAEHAKDTRDWPGYSVYRQLEPQPLTATLTGNPQPVLRKTARGLQFYWRDGGGLLPRVLVVALTILGLVLATHLARSGLRRLRRGHAARAGWIRAEPARGPAILGLTLLAAALLYSPFDHSLRHLLVLVPMIVWELGYLLAELPWEIARERIGQDGRRAAPAPRLAAVAVTAAGFLLLLAATGQPPGWDQALADARRGDDPVARETARLRAAPAGVVFTHSAAAPWFADRPAVWDPGDPSLRRRIVTLLAAGGGDGP